MRTRLQLNIYCPTVMLYVIVVKVMLYMGNKLYRVHGDMPCFVDRTVVRTFLFWGNKCLTQINGTLKAQKFNLLSFI